MNDSGDLRLASRLNVGRTADDYLGDREPPDEAGNHIPRTLCEQFPVGRGDPFVGIEFVSCLNTKQCFKAGHEGYCKGCDPDFRVCNDPEIRETEL